jgi:hypothetical protein
MVLPYSLWPGVLPDPRAVGLEPSSGTGPEALLIRATHDGICPCVGRRACTCQRVCSRRRVCSLREANTAGSVWSSPMGTPFFHERLSWFRFHPATGWDAALPHRSSALSTRTQTRARWLHSYLVCRSHWSLPRLLFARTVSRKQRHDQATTGECSALAAF